MCPSPLAPIESMPGRCPSAVLGVTGMSGKLFSTSRGDTPYQISLCEWLITCGYEHGAGSFNRTGIHGRIVESRFLSWLWIARQQQHEPTRLLSAIT